MARPARLPSRSVYRFALAAACALTGACTHEAPPARGVGNAWVRLPAVPGRPGAAYFTLHAGDAAARLVAVDSARVATVELHETMAGMRDMAGMTGMRPISGVDVPARGSVAFAPGGRHAMLFGIDPQVKPGDLVPLGFRFADGARLVASARAIAAGDPAPAAAAE